MTIYENENRSPKRSMETVIQTDMRHGRSVNLVDRIENGDEVYFVKDTKDFDPQLFADQVINFEKSSELNYKNQAYKMKLNNIKTSMVYVIGCKNGCYEMISLCPIGVITVTKILDQENNLQEAKLQEKIDGEVHPLYDDQVSYETTVKQEKQDDKIIQIEQESEIECDDVSLPETFYVLSDEEENKKDKKKQLVLITDSESSLNTNFIKENVKKKKKYIQGENLVSEQPKKTVSVVLSNLDKKGEDCLLSPNVTKKTRMKKSDEETNKQKKKQRKKDMDPFRLGKDNNQKQSSSSDEEANEKKKKLGKKHQNSVSLGKEKKKKRTSTSEKTATKKKFNQNQSDLRNKSDSDDSDSSSDESTNKLGMKSTQLTPKSPAPKKQVNSDLKKKLRSDSHESDGSSDEETNKKGQKLNQKQTSSSPKKLNSDLNLSFDIIQNGSNKLKTKTKIGKQDSDHVNNGKDKKKKQMSTSEITTTKQLSSESCINILSKHTKIKKSKLDSESRNLISDKVTIDNLNEEDDIELETDNMKIKPVSQEKHQEVTPHQHKKKSDKVKRMEECVYLDTEDVQSGEKKKKAKKKLSETTSLDSDTTSDKSFNKRHVEIRKRILFEESPVPECKVEFVEDENLKLEEIAIEETQIVSVTRKSENFQLNVTLPEIYCDLSDLFANENKKPKNKRLSNLDNEANLTESFDHVDEFKTEICETENWISEPTNKQLTPVADKKKKAKKSKQLENDDDGSIPEYQTQAQNSSKKSKRSERKESHIKDNESDIFELTLPEIDYISSDLLAEENNQKKKKSRNNSENDWNHMDKDNSLESSFKCPKCNAEMDKTVNSKKNKLEGNKQITDTTLSDCSIDKIKKTKKRKKSQGNSQYNVEIDEAENLEKKAENEFAQIATRKSKKSKRRKANCEDTATDIFELSLPEIEGILSDFFSEDKKKTKEKESEIDKLHNNSSLIENTSITDNCLDCYKKARKRKLLDFDSTVDFVDNSNMFNKEKRKKSNKQ